MDTMEAVLLFGLADIRPLIPYKETIVGRPQDLKLLYLGIEKNDTSFFV